MTYAPAIKWSGSKRPMANEIVSHFPSHIDTYYEPFCGGASILRRLIDARYIKVNRFVCGDLNDALIGFWNSVKKCPEGLADHYAKWWAILNKNSDLERKKAVFANVRDRFNDRTNLNWYHSPGDFLFIMRTCTNGMPRYNSKGEFNNSFHITRNGIEPHKLRDILLEWSKVLNDRQVMFVCHSYEETNPKEGDFMFLDPPYAGTKGMYYGGFDVAKFFEWLGKVKCNYALTFDGKAGDNDQTYPVPNKLYDKHIYIKSGNSSFRRVIGNSNDIEVMESLYMKGCVNRGCIEIQEELGL